MDDNMIIGLFYERSQQAIIELSEKYKKISLKIAFNILGNMEDAEECVNDAFLVLWNNIPPENPSPLITYLLKVVRNTSLKRYHKNTSVKRNSFYDVALEELENVLFTENSPENDLIAKEISQKINEFLEKQNKDSRIFFVRRYFYGDSISYISEITGYSPHFISVRLSRSREGLRKFLEKEGLM